ncbi:Transposase IS200-like [Syntrophomonas zehnderi OL-4]|uniref:Transposase IS200-like n=1 Tax=Syntrophomonas zehnderi OL-4 TaxID=690567 RepID=A0A0E4C7U4_9FIRM|nr:transposase [Syntrophomonas zehnderi]CFX11852.1 Transposase IS200-like [Syntrophomonas zehnderi OL-4]
MADVIRMARTAREKCDSGIYHVILRGINRQDIFYDDDDFQQFLETVGQKKTDNQFALYAYCLMSNHVHLLLQEHTDNISRIMSRIGSSYAWWYNQKYDRSGHVFQGRYGSECVKDNSYLLTVMRYIHNNPVKAEMVGKPEEYKWSSMLAYYSGREYPVKLTDTDFILGIIHSERSKAIAGLREFMSRKNDDKCLDEEIKIRKSDREVKDEIEALMNGELIGKLPGMDKAQLNEILRKIKESEGVTLRQIARVTGLSVNIIYSA